jgi:hypothetical protein
MFPALLYKEYREHRSIWLALALVGAGVLVGIPLFYQPEPSQQEMFQEVLGIIATVLAWTYGLVCGAMLLAGEREVGTQGFLDMLPTARLPLWLVKCIIGALFVYLQVALLAVQALLGGFYPPGQPVAGVLVFLAAGMIGFSWGMLFSALTRNVLNAIGLALLCQLTLLPLLSFVVFFGLTILSHLFDVRWGGDIIPMSVTGLVMLVAPLPLSALEYSRVDRTRRPIRLYGGPRLERARSASSAVRWLAWRQLRGVFLGLMIFSLLAGLAVIGRGLFSWPLLSLGLGAFCGVIAFLDEQSGAYRLLGEQRFPLGTIWRVKVGMLFLAVLACSLLMLVPAIMAHLFLPTHAPHSDPRDSFAVRIFGTPLMGELIPIGLFLFLWPMYGFAIGNVCGLLFRKPLVAMVVAFGLGILLAGVWAPSLMLGGLHLWQVAGVPFVLLVCARLLIHVWASDRLLSWTTASYVAATVVLCAGMFALGLWYRVAEIPDTPEPEDFRQFLADLPTPEENEAGRLIRGGCSRVADLRSDWVRQAQRLGGGPEAVRAGPAESDFIRQVSDVPIHGWPDDKKQLAALLDYIFKQNWWKQFDEASRHPTGVVEDPRNLTAASLLKTLEPARLAASLFAARGLQAQKMKRDPAMFVDHLAITLALVRNLQNQAPSVPAIVARSIEASQLEALTRWLEQLDGRPELLARVAKELHDHRVSLPPDYHEQYLADYLVSLNSLDRPEEWVGRWFPGEGIVVSEPLLLQLCWRVPTEHLRQMRLLRTWHWGELEEQRLLPRQSLATIPPSFRGSKLEPGHLNRLVGLEAAQLMVALRRFWAETGRPAEQLEQLVPKYLPRIRTDPFSGRPFRYRLSQGEEIVWPVVQQQWQAGAAGGAPMAAGPGDIPGAAAEPMRIVPAGQGILWSVGPDGRDDEGKRQGLGRGKGETLPGEDLIYLVPLPADKPKAHD